MRKRPKGYVPETRPNGSTRHRVRVEGNPKLRVDIPFGPEQEVEKGQPDFWQFYYAARRGEKLEEPAASPLIMGSFKRLAIDYLDWLDARVEVGAYDPKTAKQRRSLLSTVYNMEAPEPGRTMGDYDANMPAAAMLHIQDSWGSVTAQADNSMKALRQMYEWAIPRGRAHSNPAAGIPNIHIPKGGAKPWTSADMKQFISHHGPSSTATLWLILTACTGARRDDLAWLGRHQEVRRDGLVWLEWQPGKKGSSFVSMPMLPWLYEATRSMTVMGDAYLLNSFGRPFKNGNSLGTRAQRWTKDAGLEERSSHGIRKSLAELLAEHGASENQIMAILSHSNPKTSAIYTKGAERVAMAKSAMAALAGFRIE